MGNATDSDYLKYKGRFPKNSRIFTAMFIDLFVVNILAFAVIKTYAMLFSGILDKYTLSYIGFVIYIICLFTVPILSSVKQTVGQRVAHIKIQSVDGSNMGLGTAIKRWILSIVSPMGYNHKKVPWFDRKYDTILISTKEERKEEKNDK